VNQSKECVNQSRGSGRTAKLKSGDFVLPQVDAAVCVCVKGGGSGGGGGEV